MILTHLGEGKKEVIKQIAYYSTLGLEMGLAVAVGVGIGYYLDKWLGTTPWLLILFLFFGIVAGFRSLYRALKRLEREDKER
jgi:ATP synthase protein I